MPKKKDRPHTPITLSPLAEKALREYIQKLRATEKSREEGWVIHCEHCDGNVVPQEKERGKIVWECSTCGKRHEPS